MKIGYFADGVWGVNGLRLLLTDESIEIKFVSPRYQSTDNSLFHVANENHIDYIMEKDVNSHGFIEKIRCYDCDLIVSMSFNQIFGRQIINSSHRGIVNCHAGKLPFYRGRNVLNWVLINDEKEFGITAHFVDTGIDTGDIILQKTYTITDDDDYATLLDKAFIECPRVLYEAIKLIQADQAPRIKQSDIHPFGFYCTGRGTGDERVNWDWTTREIFNFIRAICRPGPMARSLIGNKEIKLNKAFYREDAVSYKCINGAVLFLENDGFWVKTGDSMIKILEWEYDGMIRIGDRLY